MIKRRACIAAILSLVLPDLSGAAADDTASSTHRLQRTLDALATRIEALAAQTRPEDWKLLRSCLYYALAGQYLLTLQGVATRLRSGAVIYHPNTRAHHGIDPHYWLESRDHLIDCATLPRWGRVTVIPRSLVARSRAGIVPGVTRVFVVERGPDPDYIAFLEYHRARFAQLLRKRGLPAR